MKRTRRDARKAMRALTKSVRTRYGGSAEEPMRELLRESLKNSTGGNDSSNGAEMSVGITIAIGPALFRAVSAQAMSRHTYVQTLDFCIQR